MGAREPAGARELREPVGECGGTRQEASKAGSQQGAKEPVGSGCQVACRYQGAKGASRPVRMNMDLEMQAIFLLEKHISSSLVSIRILIIYNRYCTIIIKNCDSC